MSTDGVDGAGNDGGSHGHENSEPSISEEAQGSLDGGTRDGDGSSDAGVDGTGPEDEAEDEQPHGYDEVGTDVPAPDPHEPTTEERAASQERMQAEAEAARQAFETQQEAVAADQGYAEALDQEVAAQNAAAEAVDAEFAVPGTYADSHLSQGLSGVNQGLANVLGGPVDLVEMGLNGIMAAAEYVGVPESVTPEFSGSFLGSDHIAGLMADFGAIGPESADPARQTTRDVAEVGTEVVSFAVGAGLASRGVAVGQVVDDVVLDGPRAVDLELTYMPGWNATQRAAADGKAAALTEADTVVTTVERAATSLRSRYTREVGEIPDNADLDHIQDLQLGGLDDILNVGPLDSSVNRSLGAQINHRISDLDVGTPIGRVTMGER